MLDCAEIHLKGVEAQIEFGKGLLLLLQTRRQLFQGLKAQYSAVAQHMSGPNQIQQIVDPQSPRFNAQIFATLNQLSPKMPGSAIAKYIQLQKTLFDAIGLMDAQLQLLDERIQELNARCLETGFLHHFLLRCLAKHRMLPSQKALINLLTEEEVDNYRRIVRDPLDRKKRLDEFFSRREDQLRSQRLSCDDAVFLSLLAAYNRAI